MRGGRTGSLLSNNTPRSHHPHRRNPLFRGASSCRRYTPFTRQESAVRRAGSVGFREVWGELSIGRGGAGGLGEAVAVGENDQFEAAGNAQFVENAGEVVSHSRFADR